jgi:orotate phosphoribosyltransferase
LSAVQEVERDNGIPVCAIANLDSLIRYLQNQADMAQNLEQIQKYRTIYGIT